MNYQEASILANEIKPKIVIPIHYGSLVGTKDDTLNFKNNINDDIRCVIL